MIVILYYFYNFQAAQEELAGHIWDKKMNQQSEEAGLKIVVEKD